MPENRYKILFGFSNEEQFLSFINEESKDYDIMKLLKEDDYYIDMVINYNCRYWLIAKLYGFSASKTDLVKIVDEEDL